MKPLSFRTNWSADARISSSVAGGLKLCSVLMFRHMCTPRGYDDLGNALYTNTIEPINTLTPPDEEDYRPAEDRVHLHAFTHVGPPSTSFRRRLVDAVIRPRGPEVLSTEG